MDAKTIRETGALMFKAVPNSCTMEMTQSYAHQTQQPTDTSAHKQN